ncbi:hypothetical protein BJ322DRAFT_780163 [Thelephora terrestris]|uniref:F-box domain-containing protein n=1 Tax=Thelephora terrestris TaxID=56493 RepID=A0A9P6L836_9AGAM|nr:hypothetical protein BJ322DRAFT_780163 [Thelephora terrestris]
MPPTASTNRNKLVQRDPPVSEANIESIRALEEQIREHETAIIKLKRARNSLLNVSKLPPEILGDIFCLNATIKDEFELRETRSHNFLLACHYWYEVALRTPDVWSYWGDDVEEWAKRHLQHTTAPLDLVLSSGELERCTLDDSLRNALQDRAMQDTIRWIHLGAENSVILNAVLSSLAGCDGIRPSSVESVIISSGNVEGAAVVSDFLASHRFPKLRRLELSGCTISSWDLLTSTTSVLQTLLLDSESPTPTITSSPTPTITSSQILSILRSNPSLREITLRGYAIPDDGGGNSPRVPLIHLRKLYLEGRPRGVFTFLRQLDYPRNMEHLDLYLMNLTAEDISRIVGPYIRDDLQRRRSSQNGLGVNLYSCDDIKIGDPCRSDFSAPGLEWMNMSSTISICDLENENLMDLITYVPREVITHLGVGSNPILTAFMSAQLPSLRVIHFRSTPLHLIFSQSNLGQEEMFP